MSFFTVGNLLTLGISVLMIVLVRYLDRHSRSVDLARNYGKQLKEEIRSFAEEKAAAVLDYGIELEVKRTAAKEVLNRLTESGEDLAGKAAMVNQIGERISAYDKSFEELMRMTARVEENFARLRDEAVYVEQVDKKIGDLQSSCSILEQDIRAFESRFKNENAAALEKTGRQAEDLKNRFANIEKDMESLEFRFERENAEALEKTAETLFGPVRATVSDLQAAAETIERQVEDHREEVNRVEREREARLAGDLETINRALEQALDKAGDRSTKLEEAAFAKLRDEALARAKRFNETLVEKLGEFREQAKIQAAEVQELIRSGKNEQKTFREDWRKEIEAQAAEIQKTIEACKAGGETFKEEWMRGVEAQSAEIQRLIEASRTEGETFKEDWKRELEVQAGEIQKTIEACKTGGETFKEEWMRGVEAQAAEMQKIIEASRAEGETFKEDWIRELEAQSAEIQKIIEASRANGETFKEEWKRELEAQAGEMWKAIEASKTGGEAFKEDWKRSVEAQSAEIQRLIEASRTEEEAFKEGRKRDLEIQAAEIQKTIEASRANGETFKEEWMRGVEAQALEIQKIIEASRTEGETFKEEWMRGVEVQAAEMQKIIEASRGEGENFKENWIRDLEARMTEMQKTIEACKIEEEAFKEDWKQSMEAQVAEIRERIESGKAEQFAFQDGWKRDIEALDALVLAQRAQWDASAEEMESKIAALGKTLSQYAADAEKRVIEETEEKLAEYREVQARHWERLDTTANDAAKLEMQLRALMKEAEERVVKDFSLFEEDQKEAREREVLEQKEARERETLAFTRSLDELKASLSALDQDFTVLRDKAAESVAEKYQLFEAEFLTDLENRRGEADRRLGDWAAGLDLKMETLAGEVETERKQRESAFGAELKAGLDRLKDEASAFEEGIRAGIAETDSSFAGLRLQLKADLEDTRAQAENLVKAELGRYALEMEEKIRQNERTLEDWQARFNSRLREADDAVESARVHAHDLLAETGDRITLIKEEIDQVRDDSLAGKADILNKAEAQVKLLEESVREAEKRIKDFGAQTRLFERADELKLELERRIEDLKGDLKGLDQRRTEAAQIEAQCVTVRRIGDEVNAKMTRFLSEKHRLDVMENDFNRLVATSQAVEEKLRSVTTSDDLLQGIQLQLRNIDDAIKETEERFQRLENKNQMLDETGAAIDRNFRSLEESEAALKRLNGDIEKSMEDLETLRPAITELSGASEKAKEAYEKLGRLDENLEAIEKRIKDMQVAREWLARTETRLGEINKQTQDQLKLLGKIRESEGKSQTAGSLKGAPDIKTQDQVKSLIHQGWKDTEIANMLELSMSEVELIREIGLKD